MHIHSSFTSFRKALEATYKIICGRRLESKGQTGKITCDVYDIKKAVIIDKEQPQQINNRMNSLQGKIDKEHE